jgi:hypothetical protein
LQDMINNNNTKKHNNMCFHKNFQLQMFTLINIDRLLTGFGIRNITVSEMFS